MLLTYSSIHPCILEGKKYIEELNWWLVPVHGIWREAKRPLFGGWPDFQPGIEHLISTFEFNADAGLGVNLGASKLIDLESDTPKGEWCWPICAVALIARSINPAVACIAFSKAMQKFSFST